MNLIGAILKPTVARSTGRAVWLHSYAADRVAENIAGPTVQLAEMRPLRKLVREDRLTRVLREMAQLPFGRQLLGVDPTLGSLVRRGVVGRDVRPLVLQIGRVGIELACDVHLFARLTRVDRLAGRAANGSV